MGNGGGEGGAVGERGDGGGEREGGDITALVLHSGAEADNGAELPPPPSLCHCDPRPNALSRVLIASYQLQDAGRVRSSVRACLQGSITNSQTKHDIEIEGV